MIDLTYPKILDYIRKYIDTGPKRTESAAFLIWYLENYYRLDQLDAIDAVCDQSGDKGIDGIYLNDDEEIINIFQVKISLDNKRTIGDTVLKQFFGTLSQFEDKDALVNLMKTAGSRQVVGLIERLDLVNKVEQYDIKGIFVSNVELDSNGEAFLKSTQDIEFVGKGQLETSYIHDSREIERGKEAVFDITGFSVSKYSLDPNTKAVITHIKAKELVQLSGIESQALFAFNVRGPLGSTKVNRDIVRSIKDSCLHKTFPLFHNGITIICDKINDTVKNVEIEDYYVVNGCQSLTALYQNRSYLTDDLKILTKFVQVGAVTSTLSEMITRYSNNQNGVKPRDFKSNHTIQIRLQNEFKKLYNKEYFYEIKEGEKPGEGELISNETAGIHLWSFDVKEPWNTHRKYQVFEDKYVDLFARPEVNADRIVMLHEIDKVILSHIPTIINQLFGKYALTRYAMFYILRNIFENEEAGKELIGNPIKFVRAKSDRVYFGKCVNTLVEDIIVDLNEEVKGLGEDFDYKSKLRNEDWVKELARETTSNYLKVIKRRGLKSFTDDWNSKP